MRGGALAAHGLLLAKRKRSEAEGVGARFIAPCGGVGHTPESVHRIRQQHLLQVMQLMLMLHFLSENSIFPLFSNQMCAQTQNRYDE